MPKYRMSEHLALEIAAVITRARPIDPGEPVPGCACETCTGIAPDDPARVPAWRRRDPRRAARTDEERRREWDRRVDTARHISVIEVAQILCLGDPVKQGRELAVRCPLHEDKHPSLRIDVDDAVWFCDPCGQGGDAIALYMLARRLEFADAVRELVA